MEFIGLTSTWMGNQWKTSSMSLCSGPGTKMWLRLNRLWKRLVILFLAVLIGLVILSMFLWEDINEIPDRLHFPFLNPEPASKLFSPTDIFHLDPESASSQHPINELIESADKQHDLLLSKETFGLKNAARAYRQRRGRHPPPGFDRWVGFAHSHNCRVIEELFDRIYDDLNPFWSLSAADIRANAAAMPHYIRVRKGRATRSPDTNIFMASYFDLIQKIAPLLPDLDIPINPMDEPRVLVPWTAIKESMDNLTESLGRQNLTRTPYKTTLTRLSDSDVATQKPSFVNDSPYWNLARKACPPDTEAAVAEMDVDLSTPPVFSSSYPYGTHHGYVKNWTVSQDVCLHPQLRDVHGTFVEPISISTSQSLIPMFSGSKLLQNNDILLPAAVYWSDEDRFAVKKHPIAWNKKRNEVFWRGTASGGRNKAENWTRFQRHRLVSMLNGTQVAMALEASSQQQQQQQQQQQDGQGDHQRNKLPDNFPLPNQKSYPLTSAKLNVLPDWLRSFSNVAFTWLECFPATRDYGCAYSGSWYRRGRPVSMHRMFHNKYLPDVDGNSFSGRFRAFMLSNSLPIKATIYTEWHDARLVPWRHFVPMDNTFVDLWSILEFLFRNDEMAERIARQGREWAERVLRKEDMLAYVYRLLLEYARVSDPEREQMGFGDDLGA